MTVSLPQEESTPDFQLLKGNCDATERFTVQTVVILTDGEEPNFSAHTELLNRLAADGMTFFLFDQTSKPEGFDPARAISGKQFLELLSRLSGSANYVEEISQFLSDQG